MAKIRLQLHTVRDETEKDFFGTIKKVAEVGEGVIDIPALINQAKKFNVGWYIVEQQEFNVPPMESIVISYKNLEKYSERTS